MKTKLTLNIDEDAAQMLASMVSTRRKGRLISQLIRRRYTEQKQTNAQSK